MSRPAVTIIVLNYNGLADTRLCLKHLLQTTYPNYHIVVVDNGSAANEAITLKRVFNSRRINFIRFRQNLGFSGGNNVIMVKTRTPYIALINNDVFVKPGWLSPLVAVMEKDRKTVMAQPKILWARDHRYFDYAGAAGGFIDFLGYPFTRGRIFSTLEKDCGQYDKRTEIFWASGAAMLLRRSVLDEVGYFDEIFFNYMEEIDLCYRILQRGYRIIYEPASVVYHKVASTASHDSGKKRFLEHRNNLIMTMKNFTLRKLAVVLPFRLVMEAVSFVYYLGIGRWDYSVSVAESIFSLIFLMPKYLKKRKLILHRDDPSIERLIYSRSIVFDYFILGKKTFQSIVKLNSWKIQ